MRVRNLCLIIFVHEVFTAPMSDILIKVTRFLHLHERKSTLATPCAVNCSVVGFINKTENIFQGNDINKSYDLHDNDEETEKEEEEGNDSIDVNGEDDDTNDDNDDDSNNNNAAACSVR